MWILMILCGALAGYLSLLLSKKLIIARKGEIPQKGLVTGKYAPLFWVTLGSAGFGLIQLFDAGLLRNAEYAVVYLICLCIGAVDFTIRKIPNSLLLALIANRTLFLALNFSKDELKLSLWGFGAAVVIFMLPSLLKINVGAGDIKLAAITGFYLGVNGFLQAMIIMAVTITIYGFYLMIRRIGNLRSKTAMGPYLVFGMFCSMLFPVI